YDHIQRPIEPLIEGNQTECGGDRAPGVAGRYRDDGRADRGRGGRFACRYADDVLSSRCSRKAGPQQAGRNTYCRCQTSAAGPACRKNLVWQTLRVQIEAPWRLTVPAAEESRLG